MYCIRNQNRLGPDRHVDIGRVSRFVPFELWSIQSHEHRSFLRFDVV